MQIYRAAGDEASEARFLQRMKENTTLTRPFRDAIQRDSELSNASRWPQCETEIISAFVSRFLYHEILKGPMYGIESPGSIFIKSSAESMAQHTKPRKGMRPPVNLNPPYLRQSNLLGRLLCDSPVGRRLLPRHDCGSREPATPCQSSPAHDREAGGLPLLLSSAQGRTGVSEGPHGRDHRTHVPTAGRYPLLVIPLLLQPPAGQRG